ncbi:MAG: HAD hydrolase-like protein [Gemmatimonadales bacterium]
MSRLAARQSPLGTIAQTLPRLGRVLGNLRPTWHLDSLDALDDAFVARHAIRAILWDVDGTLTTFHGPEVAPPARRFLALCRHPGLRHAILSNAGEARYRELGTIFPEIPVLKGYRVAGEVAMRELRHGRDSWPAERVAEVVAGGGVPLRKPDGELVRAAANLLEVDLPGVVMVGDQYLTDIAGANLAGARSIKLAAIAPETLPPGIRAGQRVERLLYRLLHGRPIVEGEATPRVETR